MGNEAVEAAVEEGKVRSRNCRSAISGKKAENARGLMRSDLHRTMNTPPTSSRRRFLQHSLFATGASVIGFQAVVSSKSPNSKMNVACIGKRGQA